MFDTVILNGTIADGTGKPCYNADIGIREGEIAEIGALGNAAAKKVVDASNKIVAPGFIDIHSHADFVLPEEKHNEILKPLVMQGITTFIGGNCGFSCCFIPPDKRGAILAHLENLNGQSMDQLVCWETPAEYMELVQKKGMLLNAGILAGHGTLRIAASGLVTRVLTVEEQKLLERYLDTCMEMGCFGLSTGLQYFPGLQSDQDELLGCGKVLRKYGGIFTSHLRSYSHTLDNALDEVFQVGQRSDIPVQISHLYWQPYTKGLTGVTKAAIQAGSFLYNRLRIPIPIEKGLEPKLKLIERKREEGLQVTFDLVPSSQGFTELFAFLPPYASEGSKGQALERLKDRAFRKKVLWDIENVEPVWPHRDGATWSFNYLKMTGWNGLRVMAVASDHNRWMEGKTFPEIGKAIGKEPFDVICDLLIEENGQVMVFHTPTRPDDPFTFRSMWSGFTHPLSMPSTDTILRPVGRPAQVYYDCFPRFIDIFVKQEKLLSLEEAIRKCTSLPAATMKIGKRGTLEKGNYADIVIFDLARLGSRATFENPAVYPTGIDHVFVNGKPVVSEGEFNKETLAGMMLRPAS
ncbi:MAG TPA: amidohydrolase family protein [Bacillota bacterium]|nr:amidohydrolase family protein [Bacillota bacterium]